MQKINEKTKVHIFNTACRMENFTINQLSAEAHFSMLIVRATVREWIEVGHCEELDELGPKNRTLYRIRPAREAGKLDYIKPVQSKLGNMWTAMVSMKTFSAKDICARASTEEIHVEEIDAQAYCSSLIKGEKPHLRVYRKACPGKHPAIYLLINNTGPKPPQVKRVSAVFDPNLGELTYIAPVRL